MKTNYEEKRAARLERFQDLAAKNEKKSEDLFKKSSAMASVIPFGQPILVGHHSEQRDRNYRDKIHNTMGRAVDASDKAAYYAKMAENIENNNAISSDNPDAIQLLKNKLALLEKNQELMKIIKSYKISEADKIIQLMALGLKENIAIESLKPVYGHPGIPSFTLTNNNANIRNVKMRIAKLENIAKLGTEKIEINGVSLEVNAEDNRVKLFFPGIPSEEIRNKLKHSGFHWSRYEGAWMRQISNAAIFSAKEILNNICQIQKYEPEPTTPEPTTATLRDEVKKTIDFFIETDKKIYGNVTEQTKTICQIQKYEPEPTTPKQNINLKVNETAFDEILAGTRSTLKHGYSKNKKYTRLMTKYINLVTLIATDSKRTCTKKFAGISVINKNDKMMYEITLQ
jgi:hypothetical protein